MNTIKKTLILVAALLLCAVFVSAENWLNDSFADFGIENIGIYTEAYQDERVEDIETDYVYAYTAQDVSYFRYVLCNYDPVTPQLTSSGYPLGGNTGSSNEINTDTVLQGELSDYLSRLNWDSSIISDFSGGTLKTLLSKAASEGLDAVLVVRYYPVDYFIPIENYKQSTSYGYSYTTTTYSASIGKLATGMSYIPAMELYDAKTGLRLWYSAYLTGTVSWQDAAPYQFYVNTAKELFAEGDSTGGEAAEKLIAMTLDNEKAPFPKPADSGSRNDAMAASQASAKAAANMFWSDLPNYKNPGSLISFGYTFDYLGDIPFYDDDDISYDDGVDAGATAAFTFKGLTAHRLDMQMFSFGTGNIWIEPNMYMGFVPEVTMQNVSVSVYNEWSDSWTTYVDDLTASGFYMGFDLTLKYFLRFDEIFSAYIGGRGTFELLFLEYENENGNISTSQYEAVTTGLMGLGSGAYLTASAVAGLRWDLDTPIEIYGMFTPLGAGGGMAFAGGITWHCLPVDWLSPYSKNVDGSIAF